MKGFRNFMYEFHIKNKTRLAKIGFVGIVYILLYQIPLLRYIIKDIFLYLNRWLKYVGFRLEIDQIKNIYYAGEKIVIAYFGVYVLYTILVFNLFKIFEAIRRNEKPKNRFEESMIRYLENNSLRQCYLLTGKWGSGKSYSVNTFFDDYYKFSAKKIYRISCFGLGSREQVEKEINSQIEINDDSIYSACTQMIKYIPIIGELLYNMLKRNYSINNLKKGTIFIFDDFERVTSQSNMKMHNYREIYHKNPFMFRNLPKQQTEFKEINKEMKKIEEAFKLLSHNEVISVEQVYYEKYNAIIGLFNELIETYHMKVVIICNADILGYEYVNGIFRGKLNCITYNQTINGNVLTSLINSAVEGTVLKEDDLKKHVKNILLKYKDKLYEEIVPLFDFNLRYVEAIIYAFLDTVRVLENDITEDMEFLKDLFISIIVTHYLYYTNRIEHLESIPSGGNIKFYLGAYYGENGIEKLVDKMVEGTITRWVDITISGFWIMNMSTPHNIVDVKEEYLSYQYYDLEEEIMQENLKNLVTHCQSMRLEHVLYIQRHWNQKRTADSMIDFTSLLNKVHFFEGDIDSILLLVDTIFNSIIFDKFESQLNSKIYSHFKINIVNERTFRHTQYNKQLKNEDVVEIETMS